MVVVGAGTVGLLTVLALHQLNPSVRVHVVAKHRHQQERAVALGATAVHPPGRATRGLRRVTTARMQVPERGSQFLLGGVDIAFECTGGAGGLTVRFGWCDPVGQSWRPACRPAAWT